MPIVYFLGFLDPIGQRVPPAGLILILRVLLTFIGLGGHAHETPTPTHLLTLIKPQALLQLNKPGQHNLPMSQRMRLLRLVLDSPKARELVVYPLVSLH